MRIEPSRVSRTSTVQSFSAKVPLKGGDASAFSISAIVFPSPKIAAKEPKRGPWLWPSSTS